MISKEEFVVKYRQSWDNLIQIILGIVLVVRLYYVYIVFSKTKRIV